jgi:tetratricopeptide (TPR) repeat protein
MVQSKTNGHGTDDERPASEAAASTHDSDPGDGADATADADVLARGATLGRYLVLERLGAGAMGVVYAAYDPELDRKVAIKILRPQGAAGDQGLRHARLVREAKAIAKLSHSNVVGIFDVGVHEDQVFLAMEYLGGGTLRQWMTAAKRPWRETVALFLEIGNGLAAAHAEGLVHRDFKPDNVLLDKAGKPKIVDFGLVHLSSGGDVAAGGSSESEPNQSEVLPALVAAVAVPEALTRTGALTGTPAYMAPEQFLGKAIDARTDQFAFCATLYEALYGERPFAGETVIRLAENVTSERVKPTPKSADVPNWVRTSLLRGLRADPSRRFPKIDDVLAALGNDPAKRRRKWGIAGATILAMLAAVGLTRRLGSNQQTMCTGGAAHLAGVWEPGPAVDERRAAIHRAFLASGKSYAEQAYASVARLLDQYVARWTGMYTEACEATHVRGEQSAEVLDMRMACLNERLGNARALTDVFAAADGKVVENAVSAAASLPSLDRCADVGLLRALVKPPEDAPTRKRVDELRAELAKLIALRDSGQCARAIPKADALIKAVRAVGYQPLVADTSFAAAQLGNHCGEDAQMVQRFKDAYAAASASHYDDVAAQAAALIPSYATNRLGQVAVAREWVLVAQGAVARVGHETLANAMLAQAEGMLALMDHDYPRVFTAADRSIDITRRLLGADDLLTIIWEANKGDWEFRAGRLAEALQTDVRARQSLEHLLGREHPRVAMVWYNEAEVLNQLGRHAEAAAAYQRAAQIFRQSGADADVLAWALTGLGRTRLGENQPAAAIEPLEEALSIRLDTNAPPAQKAETRFALARALWSRPEARKRALGLAARARADSADDKKALSEIDAWLAHARAEAN